MQMIQNAISSEALEIFKRTERETPEQRAAALDANLRRLADDRSEQEDRRNSRQKRRDKALVGAK